jgi:hypothetical protein
MQGGPSATLRAGFRLRGCFDIREAKPVLKTATRASERISETKPREPADEALQETPASRIDFLPGLTIR